jgi:hypothetical protein
LPSTGCDPAERHARSLIRRREQHRSLSLFQHLGFRETIVEMTMGLS